MNTNKRYLIGLIALCFTLAIVVSVQGFQIVRLEKNLVAVEEPQHEGTAVLPSATGSGSSQNLPTNRNPQPIEEYDPFQDLALGMPIADPLAEMHRMHDEMNRAFGDSFARIGASGFLAGKGTMLSPSLDMTDKGDRYEVRMDVPGAEKSDIRIETGDRSLTVSAKRTETLQQNDPNNKILRRERRSGEFRRSVTLPEAIDPSGVKAAYENGVLTITLPKTHESKPQTRQVPIQ